MPLYTETLYSLPLRNSVLLSTFFYGSYAQAQEWSFGAGIGRRNIEEVEENIQNYIQKRKYTKEVSGLEETIHIDGTKIPYFFLDLSYVPKNPLMPRGTMEHQIQLDWISSFFTEEKDEETISLQYQGQDFGEAQGEWKYKINWYTSIMYGPEYTPLESRKGKMSVKGSFTLRGGLSYIDADVSLGLSLKENIFYTAMDPQFIAKELGIAEQTTLTAHVFGVGYFFHPECTPSIQLGRVEIQGHFGYRAEIIPVTVEEKLKSARVTKEKAKGKLDLSGETLSLEVKYHF